MTTIKNHVWLKKSSTDDVVYYESLIGKSSYICCRSGPNGKWDLFKRRNAMLKFKQTFKTLKSAKEAAK